MISRSLLPQRCTVWRQMPQKDEYGTPLNSDDDYQEVAQYPCRLSRKSIQATPGAPNTAVSEVYMLYLPAAANIQAGDLVNVSGVGEYRTSEPYRPNSHHTEVQVEREESA